ncbi:1-deoxy-D-xylulose-5-phosphate synthase [candidate division KSB1 bacterium]|nr:1-deoxy-D-xylulose-5-phosphate synthase [candidate division KSB1 bacterium]
MYTLLNEINSPDDIKKLDISQLTQLAKELREYIISVISENGGHLAPNLGVVELTLVLHYLYNTPDDKIIWDVGHQAYIHKIITGRKDRFPTIRQYGGISGFPKIEESKYDHFGVGHASTSISAAIGIACARDLKKEDNAVIAVIGDGSMTNGLAFEGLNNAGSLNKDITVILNDNNMSISQNVGALHKYLTYILTTSTYNKVKADIWELTGRLSRFGQRIRSTMRQVDEGLKALVVPGLLFERLGFRYIGPVDGHDIPELIRIFREVQKMKGPILVHVCTKKGKGYELAEKNATHFHGLTPFNRETGAARSVSPIPTYSKVFGNTLTAIAEKDEKIVAISAAMAVGTGLTPFCDKFPERFFDVGIAEGHAVTFAAGLATQGMKPVVAIYSSFLQRSYDQIIHDVALQKLPVIFAIDRAGLVGDDGPTHHGIFDLSFLRHIPNMVVMAPKDEQELQDMLWTATHYQAGPIAIRYPRGQGVGKPLKSTFNIIPIGQGEIVTKCEGKELAILTIGSMVYPAIKVAEKLSAFNIQATVVNMRFIKPLDDKMLRQIALTHDAIVTLEDNVKQGGFGSAVNEYLIENQLFEIKSLCLGLPDEFVEHGANEILYHNVGLDLEGITNSITQFLGVDATPEKWESGEYIPKNNVLEYTTT